jgi:hypothetical protein
VAFGLCRSEAFLAEASNISNIQQHSATIQESRNCLIPKHWKGQPNDQRLATVATIMIFMPSRSQEQREWNGIPTIMSPWKILEAEWPTNEGNKIKSALEVTVKTLQ